MPPPSSTFKALRQEYIEKLYKPRWPMVSTTTSDSDSYTVLKDTILAPAAQDVEFRKAWVLITEQPTKVDSGAVINEGGTFSATDVTLTVDDGTLFLAGDGIQIEDEILTVTAIATHDLTVVRGVQDTTAATHVDTTTIYIVGPAVGEVARVTTYSFTGSSSQLTLAPALTGSIVSGTDYEIHFKYHPDYAEDRINDILGNLETGYLIPLSIIVDGDMEDDPATNFAVGGTETLANDTTYVRRGRQSLKVTAGADDDYAKSTSATYLPGDTQVLCATDCYITAGDSAKIILYDETNSADIETAESDESGWVHLEFLATTPTTSEEVSLRLEAQTNGDVIYFDYAVLLPTSQAILTPPGEVEYAHDFGRLFYFPHGDGLAGSTNDNAYVVDQQPARHWSSYSLQRDDTGVLPTRLEVHKTPVTRPLFIEGDVDFAALSADTDTTVAPADLVVQLALADTYDDMADEEEEMGHTEAATLYRTNAMRTRVRMRNTYTDFRPVRTEVVGAGE